MLLLIALLALGAGMFSLAASPTTFEEARRLSAEQGLPLLIEFVRDD